MARVTRATGFLAQQLRHARGDVRIAVVNPGARRLQLGLGANQAGEWAYFTALEIFAYENGGPFAVGLVGLLSELPSALAAPFTAPLANRFPRERLLFALGLVRAAELCGAAFAYSLGAPPVVYYTLLGIDSVLASAIFPAQQGLVRRLLRSRAERRAAAAVTSMADVVGGGLGGLVGGVLLGTTNLGIVYVVSAALLATSAGLFLRARPSRVSVQSPIEGIGAADLDTGRAAELPTRAPAGGVAGTSGISAAAPFGGHSLIEDEEEEAGNLFGDFIDGVRAIAGLRDVRVLLALFAIDSFMEGTLDVFVIVLALKVLGIGAEGVGALSVVEMLGGLMGGLLAFNMLRARGLAVRWGMMGFIDGIPPALLAISPTLAVTVVVLIAWEGIDTIDDAMGLELLRRVVPEDLMSQVLGLDESVHTFALTLGTIIAPAMIVLLGIRGALLAVGIAAPLLVVLQLRGLRRVDANSTIPEASPGSC